MLTLVKRQYTRELCSPELYMKPQRSWCLLSRAYRQVNWPCGLAGRCHDVPIRGAKTVTRRKLKELEQGPIQTSSLPGFDLDDRPQYPPLLREVENNMIKFENCVLLTEVGNFYELYFKHAEEIGPLLGLKVSARKTTNGPVAMAGFPVFQLERFLKILVEDLNKYVAISEQIEISKHVRAKGAGPQFDRKVLRVVTPGTLIDEKFLNPSQNNFLLSVHNSPAVGEALSDQNHSSDEVGLAWLDLSTGDFFTQVTTRAQMPSVLLQIGAREIVLADDSNEGFRKEVSMILGHSHELITFHSPQSQFSDMAQWNPMLESPVREDAEQSFSRIELLAGHLLLEYLSSRLQGLDCRLRHPERRSVLNILAIDRSSLRGLEILETAREGFGKGSLCNAVRHTVTTGGARMLRDRLIYPSTSLPEINMRLDLVTHFRIDKILRDGIISHLRKTHDVKRLVQKFTLNKGDADDMLALASAINETAHIQHLLSNSQPSMHQHNGPVHSASVYTNPIPSLLSRFVLDGPIELGDRILHAIDEEGLDQKHRLEDEEASKVAILAHSVVKTTAPEELASLPKDVRSRTKIENKSFINDGEEPWIMRRSASDTLTRLHNDLEELYAEKEALQTRLRVDLSAPTLALRWTPGLGHICHIKTSSSVTKSKMDELDARMVSSSKSTQSFYLSDWSKLGNGLDQLRKGIRTEEQRIFGELKQHVVRNLLHLRKNATIMDELDVACSFAVLAEQQSWTRPILNDGVEHKVIGGRHPTVKLGLEEKGRSFVSNDLYLNDKERAWIVTGPNMAGKSTFLRQNALITILAQVGSYVPAEYAEIGIVDQIFSRIGAADDLFRDQSTFMVEMLETAAILKHATPRSFVIMDEVGRGTTPEDGVAVAFASFHHIYHHNRCRTLFATHFHALNDMTKDWDCVGRYCTDIVEDESGSFSFLHKLKPGVNKQSHALKIAKLAGLPNSAIAVARTVFEQLRSGCQ